jgi:hypothetical protein
LGILEAAFVATNQSHAAWIQSGAKRVVGHSVLLFAWKRFEVDEMKVQVDLGRNCRENSMDLLIRDRRPLGGTVHGDVGVEGESVAVTGRQPPASAPTDNDAAARVLALTYVNGRVHLEKSNPGDIMAPNVSHYLGSQLSSL